MRTQQNSKIIETDCSELCAMKMAHKFTMIFKYIIDLFKNKIFKQR